MTHPTFLGIGAVRSGSTWLHRLLATHPETYVPMRRKEVKFFDINYNRGIEWYEKFFPPSRKSLQYRAIGEISPTYLYHPECPQRIAEISTISKLILILRNPVDRAYSEYGLLVRDHNSKVSFEQVLSSHKSILQRGFYSQPIKNYLAHFSQDQLLVLIYERAVADHDTTKNTLAQFLNIDVNKFPQHAGTARINKSYIPKFRSAYAFLVDIAVYLYKWDMDWMIYLAKKFGIKKLLGEGGKLSPMKAPTRKRLKELYNDEVLELESLLSIDLQCWKQ